MRSASGGLRMREEENESEEGAVEDDYGSGKIDGFSEIGSFGEIDKREELRCKEKRTNSNAKRKDEIKERERESQSE